MSDFEVHLPAPHDRQAMFIDFPAKRKIIRAGRRGGKTVGVAILAVIRFLQGNRVLYAAPTSEQIDRFWTTITCALDAPIRAGIFRKNETEHVFEVPGTEQRIRAKTAWNADTLRGDYADLLVLDEWQLMDEDAWALVGAPMMLDNNGDAVFIYTPPSLHSRSVSKARDPQHAARMYKAALADTTGRWAAFHFTSHDNPHLSQDALADITHDMTNLAIRMEILAEDVDEAPGALWTRAMLDAGRVLRAPELEYVVVGVDPSATSTGDEAGIVTVGRTGDHIYPLADDSIQASPQVWATAAVTAYYRHKANRIVAEANNGGEMVAAVIKQVDASVIVELVHASRGKATRAEPIVAIYEQCVAAGTIIQTHRGGIPIEQISTQDMVWTRNGLRRVLWSGKTGVKDTLCLRGKGFELTCTANHPIFTDRGFVHAEHIVPKYDTIMAWENIFVQIAEHQYLSEIIAVSRARRGFVGQHLASPSDHMSPFEIYDTLSKRTVTTDLGGIRADTSSIAMYGNRRMAPSPMDGTYTTLTQIQETTRLEISSQFPRLSMVENLTIIQPGLLNFERETAGTGSDGGQPENQRRTSAMNVIGNSTQQQQEYDFAPLPVTRAITIDSVEPSRRQAVYNLEISGKPEFFANGILVHNCRAHHVGSFPALEDELCLWLPGDASPNRLDALVWAATKVISLKPKREAGSAQG